MTGPKPFGLPPKKLYNFTILIAETPRSRHRLQPDIAAQENVRHSLHGAAKRPQLPPSSWGLRYVAVDQKSCGAKRRKSLHAVWAGRSGGSVPNGGLVV